LEWKWIRREWLIVVSRSHTPIASSSSNESVELARTRGLLC